MPQSSNKLRILVFGGRADTLINFRGPLIRALLAAGHEVSAVAGEHDTTSAATLAAWGVDLHIVPLSRAGLNPAADIRAVLAIVRVIRMVRPDIFFSYQIKPSVYGLIAARIVGTPRRIAMITGLGYAFTDGNEPKRRIVRFLAGILCRSTLRFADRVIFHNPDDEALFVSRRLVSRDRTALVAGSGIDLAHFAPAPPAPGSMTFLMIARLIRDKGVCEFVEAAREVRKVCPQARFLLLGAIDPNPSSLRRSEVEAWQREGTVQWLGEKPDVRADIAACQVLVLPSYREGMPRSVLEAMAMGRAVIATDVPGCREAVRDGVSGFLVSPRNARQLAETMLRFLKEPGLVVRMGTEGRRLAESTFDANQVNARMIECLISGPIWGFAPRTARPSFDVPPSKSRSGAPVSP
jgi:glycosyltransferase involved in cell wall biosynthesis